MKHKKLIIGGIVTFVILVIIVGIAGVLILNGQKAASTVLGQNTQQGPGGFDTTSQKTQIIAAVSSGKLTQRQGDLLTAELDSRANFTPGQRPTGAGQGFPGENGAPVSMPVGGQNAFLQRTVDTLNESGLNTTLTELEEAHTAAQSAGIQMNGGFGQRGGQRPQGGFNRGQF